MVLLIWLQFFVKERLDIPKELVEGTIHCKPGAAIALLEKVYVLLTKREYVNSHLIKKYSLLYFLQTALPSFQGKIC